MDARSRLIRFGTFFLLTLCACAPSDRIPIRLLSGEADRTWISTPDQRIQLQLDSGLLWREEEIPKGNSSLTETLLRTRSEDNTTTVTISVIHVAPKPLALHSCALAHRNLLSQAKQALHMLMTEPYLVEEFRKDEKVWRLRYAVPLEKKADVRNASLLSSWTYVLNGDRCVGVGVSSLVRESRDKRGMADTDDMARFERVFSTIFLSVASIRAAQTMNQK